MPFNFAERTGARGDIYTRKLLRHSYVGGHGSWVYWQRSNGEGPYLVMTPSGATKFEYLRQLRRARSRRTFTPRRRAPRPRARGRQLAAAGLEPDARAEGRAGAEVTYTFRFQWAKDFAGVRDVLHAEGKFDTHVVPGMVVPTDLPAMFSLRTKNAIAAIEPEHPASTRVELAGGQAATGVKVYRVRFSTPRREHADGPLRQRISGCRSSSSSPSRSKR